MWGFMKRLNGFEFAQLQFKLIKRKSQKKMEKGKCPWLLQTQLSPLLLSSGLSPPPLDSLAKGALLSASQKLKPKGQKRCPRGDSNTGRFANTLRLLPLGCESFSDRNRHANQLFFPAR